MSASQKLHVVEFNLSDQLADETTEILTSTKLSFDELAIASVGMLNQARQYRFKTGKTMLITDERDFYPLPPLLDTDGEVYPHVFTVPLKEHLYKPMQEYVTGRHKVDLHERARRAIRFGTFVLSHVMPYEDEEVLFRHLGKDQGIIYQTQQ